MAGHTRKTLARSGAALLVVAIAAAAAYLLLPPRQTADVAVPADRATPRKVVSAYLHALSAHDCDTVARLVVDDLADTAHSWCEDVGTLSRVHVGAPVAEPAAASGLPASVRVRNVPVTFDLDWRFLHGDDSMEEGDTAWSYLLRSDSTRTAWRIFDQGTG